MLTIREGGTVLFGGESVHAAAGHYVPFVLWFNFLAGFVYIIADVGLWTLKHWAGWLALAIAGATLAVFAAFGVRVLEGGLYEMRTVFAMILSTAVWSAIAVMAYRWFKRAE